MIIVRYKLIIQVISWDCHIQRSVVFIQNDDEEEEKNQSE